MSEEERPQARLKITRSGKGILIMVPVPELGVSLSYVTSKAFLQQLLEGSLKRDLLGCTFIGTGELTQFMSQGEKDMIDGKKINTLRITADDPMSSVAKREREAGSIKVRDDW